MMQPVIRKNHMDIAWHEYTDENGADIPVTQASLTEKASIIGRVGIMFLSCGTGAWRVRSSMNTLAEIMGITCTADIGLMSIEYTCFDEKTCQEKNCIRCWMILNEFMDFTPRLHLDSLRHLHAVDLLFYLAVALLKCSALL